MTVETDIYIALKGLVSDRVYQNLAPDGAAKPYLVYQQVGGSAVNFFDPAVPSKKNARFQISAWALQASEASALSRRAEDALRVIVSLQTTVLGALVAVYEPGTKLHGARQDFSVWFDS